MCLHVYFYNFCNYLLYLIIAVMLYLHSTEWLAVFFFYIYFSDSSDTRIWPILNCANCSTNYQNQKLKSAEKIWIIQNKAHIFERVGHYQFFHAYILDNFFHLCVIDTIVRYLGWKNPLWQFWITFECKFSI